MVSVPPDALELALLQHAQELDLRGQVDVADLVEEQRAALGQLEAALLPLLRAGERALLVAEELGFDQALRQRGAADLDERLLGPQRVVVNGVRDELLAGARLAADEHRRVRRRHLRHLLVHLADRSAGPDDVREVVLLAQLLAQVLVFVDQPPLVLLDQPLNLDGLRDHRRDDAQELDAAVEVALGLVAQVHPERADGAAVQHDGDAHEAELLFVAVGPPGRAVEHRRLAADAGHDDRLGGFHHAAGDALAHAVLDVLGGTIESVRRFYVQLPALAQQRDHAADRAVVFGQHLEHPVQRRFEVQRA